MNEHNKDTNIHGSNKTFEGNTAFGMNLSNKRISSLETIALNWDFNKVTGSNSSGKFIVEDISSGSANTLYGWVDEIIRREHRGAGYDFVNSSTKHVNNELLTLYKKELPEVSYTADNITIAGIDQEAFRRRRCFRLTLHIRKKLLSSNIRKNVREYVIYLRNEQSFRKSN